MSRFVDGVAPADIREVVPVSRPRTGPRGPIKPKPGTTKPVPPKGKPVPPKGKPVPPKGKPIPPYQIIY